MYFYLYEQDALKLISKKEKDILRRVENKMKAPKNTVLTNILS